MQPPVPEEAPVLLWTAAPMTVALKAPYKFTFTLHYWHKSNWCQSVANAYQVNHLQLAELRKSFHHHHHHTSIYSSPITVIDHRCITESSELSANTESQTKKVYPSPWRPSRAPIPVGSPSRRPHRYTGAAADATSPAATVNQPPTHRYFTLRHDLFHNINYWYHGHHLTIFRR